MYLPSCNERIPFIIWPIHAVSPFFIKIMYAALLINMPPARESSLFCSANKNSTPLLSRRFTIKGKIESKKYFYHSITADAHVSPPPNPDSAIFIPGFKSPFRFISSSRIGTLAADIFPQ